MIRTYCDNEELRKLIIQSYPSIDGLFPHEIAMIFDASIGQLPVNNPGFASFFQNLKVIYPMLLLVSLIDRGFISSHYSIDNLSYYNTSILQTFAKKKGLKHPNNREQLVDIIILACSEEEINKELNLNFYLPTEKGKMALEHANCHSYADAADGWEKNAELFGRNSASNIKVAVHEADIQGIEVYTTPKEKWQFNIVVDGISMQIHTTLWKLEKRSNLFIRKDGHIIFSIVGVDSVTINYMQKTLIFRKLDNPNSQKVTPSHITCFDLVSEKVLYSEYDEGDSRLILPFLNYISKKLKSDIKVHSNGLVRYFVSVKNQLAKLILLSSQPDSVDIMAVTQYMDDVTENVVISVEDNNHDLRNLIQYMISEHLLDEVAVFGVPIRKIATCLYYKTIMNTTPSKSVYEYYKEILLRERECVELIEELDAADPNYVLFDIFIKAFPQEIFVVDPFRYYDDKRIDPNWLYVRKHTKDMRKDFNDRVLVLKEKGIIPTKWISEFNLFLTVKKIYSDSIYQYRASWLKQQSIDVYIPSLKIGIEYQGIQHYEAVDIFGGEAGLKTTKERDKRKSELCENNGVILLDWKYNLEINERNVKSFIRGARSISNGN